MVARLTIFRGNLCGKYDFRTQNVRNPDDEDGRGTGNQQPFIKKEAFPANFSSCCKKKTNGEQGTDKGLSRFKLFPVNRSPSIRSYSPHTQSNGSPPTRLPQPSPRQPARQRGMISCVLGLGCVVLSHWLGGAGGRRRESSPHRHLPVTSALVPFASSVLLSVCHSCPEHSISCPCPSSGRKSSYLVCDEPSVAGVVTLILFVSIF